MNNLRDYYERALQEFGTRDDGNHSLKAFSLNPGDLHVDCYCSAPVSVSVISLGLTQLTRLKKWIIRMEMSFYSHQAEVLF